ncbi:MAG: S8 family serine peptidase [Burkholderiaceae bacterium]
MNHLRPLRHRLLLSLALSLLGVLPGSAWSERGPETRAPKLETPNPAEARVIVKYKADSGLMRSLSLRSPGNMRPLHASTLSQRLRVPLSDGRTLGPRTESLRGTGLSSQSLAQQLAALPDVEWAVPDQRRHISSVPNDPLFADHQATATPVVGQWYLRAPTSTTASAINAAGAWDVTPGSAAITVAVLDTGVRLAHPDFAGKLVPGYDFVHDATTANDGDGRDNNPDDPGDWTTIGECSPGDPAHPSSWHGTEVAGLIGAATDNGTGMASAGRNVMLLPVRVLGRCGGYDSDILAAMRWASGVSSDVGVGTPQTLVNAHPARVINLSLGSDGLCPSSYADVIAEVNAAGVTVVAAAGNGDGGGVNVPANCAGVIAVAGVRHVGTKVGYSSVGPEVAISAPAGNCVYTNGTCLYPLLTTTNLGSMGPTTDTYSDGSANASLGTSFSTALVSGTVGLLLSQNPALTSDGVRAALQSGARAFPTTGAEATAGVCHAPNGSNQIECYCTTSTCGAGLLDAAGALGRAFVPTVVISVASRQVTSGASVVLDGNASLQYPGHPIAAYQWSITQGAAIASFSGATTGSSATLLTGGPGIVTVQLLVTDSTGATARSSASITVAAAPIAASGGGGGAPDWTWLLGYAAVLGTLVISRARARR